MNGAIYLVDGTIGELVDVLVRIIDEERSRDLRVLTEVGIRTGADVRVARRMISVRVADGARVVISGNER